MKHKLHERLLALEIRTDQVGAIKHQNECLREAIAQMRTGMQAQDEAICAMQRRIDKLEAEKEQPQCQTSK